MHMYVSFAYPFSSPLSTSLLIPTLSHFPHPTSEISAILIKTYKKIQSNTTLMYTCMGCFDTVSFLTFTDTIPV